MNRPCSASAVDTWVPLISARPFLSTEHQRDFLNSRRVQRGLPHRAVCRARAPGRRPAWRGSCGPAALDLPRRPPSPWPGMAGMMPALYSAIRFSTMSGSHARIAARQAADFHQQDQAHHGVRQQFSGADGVRQDQIASAIASSLSSGDAGLGEDAESRVDAVGGIAAWRRWRRTAAGGVFRIGRPRRCRPTVSGSWRRLQTARRSARVIASGVRVQPGVRSRVKVCIMFRYA